MAKENSESESYLLPSVSGTDGDGRTPCHVEAGDGGSSFAAENPGSRARVSSNTSHPSAGEGQLALASGELS